MALGPGTRLGSFEILSLLGSGGMGEVHKALDTKLNRTVALKLLPAESVSDHRRRIRFVQEAQAASALDRPNIITIHDITEAEGVHFIVMQYVAGRTLRELVGKKGLELKEAIRYAIQMADGLGQRMTRGCGGMSCRAGVRERDTTSGYVVISSSKLWTRPYNSYCTHTLGSEKVHIEWPTLSRSSSWRKAASAYVKTSAGRWRRVSPTPL